MDGDAFVRAVALVCIICEVDEDTAACRAGGFVVESDAGARLVRTDDGILARCAVCELAASAGRSMLDVVVMSWPVWSVVSAEDRVAFERMCFVANAACSSCNDARDETGRVRRGGSA